MYLEITQPIQVAALPVCKNTIVYLPFRLGHLGGMRYTHKSKLKVVANSTSGPTVSTTPRQMIVTAIKWYNLNCRPGAEGRLVRLGGQ